MKAAIGLLLFAAVLGFQASSQERCESHQYLQQTRSTQDDQQLEEFISHRSLQGRTTVSGTILIPVVIHNLYHYPSEKVTEQQVARQLEILNNCFRRRNADTTHTPEVFRPLAADVEIEFVLASSDERRAATTGILKKYTPVLTWGMDDKMKFNAEMGADGWDSRYYLNIWVCNLDRFAGYSSFPGGDPKLDGIVIDIDVFGGGKNAYSQGKTAVHETGHWLGLKHLWGDELCGDDLVDDTPKQASYTPGCPTNIRITCGNGPNGDMYMNYMDFTSDACMNMFTLGQKDRMRSLFAGGGPRESLLSSQGLLPPLIMGSEVEVPDPKWLHPQLYPNPASQELFLDLTYDTRWIGSTVYIFDVMGQPVLSRRIDAKLYRLNIAALKPGMYFLRAEKQNEKMLLKFVKQ